MSWLKRHAKNLVLVWIAVLMVTGLGRYVIGRWVENRKILAAPGVGQPYEYADSLITVERALVRGGLVSSDDDTIVEKTCSGGSYGFPYVQLSVQCKQDAKSACRLRMSAEITFSEGLTWGDLDQDQPTVRGNYFREVQVDPGGEKICAFFNTACHSQSNPITLFKVRVQDLAGDAPAEIIYFNIAGE